MAKTAVLCSSQGMHLHGVASVAPIGKAPPVRGGSGTAAQDDRQVHVEHVAYFQSREAF